MQKTKSCALRFSNVKGMREAADDHTIVIQSALSATDKSYSSPVVVDASSEKQYTSILDLML